MNQTKTTAKDFFLHLGATIALYVSVGALVDLVFSIINYCFPDALAGYFFSNSIAWPVSILIVLIPVLYVLEWRIKKNIDTDPEKKDIWIRRWRIYLTIFIGGAIMAGDLVVLINTYLNGEISTRFIYKFLVLLVIIAVTFSYYLLSKAWKAPKVRKALAVVAIAMVLGSIIGGFAISGSPTKKRDMRFDSNRAGDLRNIQWQIVSFWQIKGSLPLQLSDIDDSILSYKVPTDPLTKAPYEYTPKGKLSFELCATFARDYEDMSGRGDYYGGGYSYPIGSDYSKGGIDDNWVYKKGRTCFERTIDPDKYPRRILD